MKGRLLTHYHYEVRDELWYFYAAVGPTPTGDISWMNEYGLVLIQFIQNHLSYYCNDTRGIPIIAIVIGGKASSINAMIL